MQGEFMESMMIAMAIRLGQTANIQIADKNLIKHL